jgi:hypothetical protein
MNNLEQIREVIENILHDENGEVTDTIINALTPYLSHGITVDEASKIALGLNTKYRSDLYDPYEGQNGIEVARSLGLIVEPEHSIHILAADQKDLDPRIVDHVNEHVNELLDEPEKREEKQPGAITMALYKLEDYIEDVEHDGRNTKYAREKLDSARAEHAAMMARIAVLEKYNAELKCIPSEPESLVKTRRNYEVVLTNQTKLKDTKKGWGELLNERDYCIEYIDELEVRMKQLEGKHEVI